MFQSTYDILTYAKNKHPEYTFQLGLNSKNQLELVIYEPGQYAKPFKIGFDQDGDLDLTIQHLLDWYFQRQPEEIEDDGNN